MSFEAVLHDIVASCPGALGAALMGSDGLPIAQCMADGAEELEDSVGVMGVEFGRVLEETRKASDAVEGGALEEMAVRMGRYQVALRALDAETYLVLVLAAEGNVGKGRYLLRRHAAALREEL
jgi:predicted regulator of Ras-like GTPase activity (Roadblock/LC7/MglB family)